MPENTVGNGGMRFSRAVLPEVETRISVQVAPGSVCDLYHPSAPDHRFQLDADDRGIVRFHAKARADAGPVELNLACKRPGQSDEMYTVSLTADGRLARLPEEDEPPLGERRAPLEGDPMLPSNEELLAGGYPRRPNPDKEPARYARWLDIVLRPYTVVPIRRVAHPRVSFSRPDLPPNLAGPTLPLPPPSFVRGMFNASSSTWSGVECTKPFGQFGTSKLSGMFPGSLHHLTYRFTRRLRSGSASITAGPICTRQARIPNASFGPAGFSQIIGCGLSYYHSRRGPSRAFR
jgi:hypothetical protein